MSNKPKRKKKRTMEIPEMIKMYLNGNSTTEIGKMANVSSRYVNMVLTENNIEKRPFGHWKRQYQLKENYFKTWSNNMAYILGFFVADGFVSKDQQTIGFSQKDKSILEQIRSELGSNQPLYINERTGVYMLHFNSKIMKRDLIEMHGILPHKSLDVKLPYVPEKYLNHFMRGYFDGDGNIYSRGYTVSFVGGSLEFMTAVLNLLDKHGYKPYLTKKGKHFRLYISGRKTIKQFYNWIYSDKGLYLKRKFDAFPDKNLDLNTLHDAKLKTTKHAVAERKKAFITEYAKRYSILEACCHCGIKEITYFNWLKKDKQFCEEINRLNKRSPKDYI
jgi:intein-encoded DNA endonuclease-like protein